MVSPSLEDYKIFLEKNVKFGLPQLNRYYASVVYPMKNDFEKSTFVTQLNADIPKYNAEYLANTGYSLFSRTETTVIHVKPFDSMIEKCYRKDVVDNPKWKEAGFGFDSAHCWTNPLECFQTFSDILRTRISVRYLDGALFMLEKLKSLADSLGLERRHEYKSEEEGYYAVHFDLKYPFEIPSITFEPRKIESRIEIQINTEIQNVIVDLAHKYYEKRRMKLRSMDPKWQWDYECEEFVPNYLGHIIHYVEGMIMEVRKRSQEKGKI